MDDISDLRGTTGWGPSVWGLRVMAPGLVLVVAGLVGLAISAASAQALLGVGMVIYLAGVVITVAGIALIYRQAPPPRPNFLDLRWALLHDAVHGAPRNAGAGHLTGPPDDRSPSVGACRLSPHWRPAVWGVRVMIPGLAVILVGLIILAWSTTDGRTLIAVGVGIYVVAMVFTLVEVIKLDGDLAESRPGHARIQRALLHDATHARPSIGDASR